MFHQNLTPNLTLPKRLNNLKQIYEFCRCERLSRLSVSTPKSLIEAEAEAFAA